MLLHTTALWDKCMYQSCDWLFKIQNNQSQHCYIQLHYGINVCKNLVIGYLKFKITNHNIATYNCIMG